MIQDPIKRLKLKIAAKKKELEQRKFQIQVQKDNIAATKERFQNERTRELSEYKNIFTAFNDKLKTDLRTDIENK